MRIAVGGIHTECSTYSPVLMTEEDFRVLRGQTLLDAEYFSFMKAEGVEHLPLLHARAVPGGPVSRPTYDAFKAEFYQSPALTPPIAALADQAVEPPVVGLDGAQASLSHAAPDSLRAWVVYAQSGQDFVIDRVVPAQTTTIDLSPGTWAISAAGKHGVESQGVLVTVP